MENLNVQPPGAPAVVIQEATAENPGGAGAAQEAPTTEQEHLQFDRESMVAALRLEVSNPMSKKFNKGQKSELTYIFDVDESFDLLPEATQTHHLERLRLIYLVAHHNWAVALADKNYNERQKVSVRLPDFIANLKPRSSRRSTFKGGRPKDTSQKKK